MCPESRIPHQVGSTQTLQERADVYPAPIFIGGPDRCGKTTLQAFLSSHPHIAIPVVGSNLWSYFYDQYGDLHHPQNFERCLQGLLHYKHALALKLDADRLRREFWLGDPTYARLFGLIHTQYAEAEGKPRWGDQTGLIERYADQIFTAYPDAKMIHMLRDPRDRYAASLAMWPDGKGKVGAAAARWQYSARLAVHNQSRFHDRYQIVRFEDLVREPEKTLQEVCRFLGEGYQPEMLTMAASPGHREKLQSGYSGPSGQMPLSERFIGTYREELAVKDIAFLQHLAGGMMHRFGYALDPVQMTSREKMGYWLKHAPNNLGRMVAWQAQETLNQKLPHIVGRKPSAHMLVPADRATPLIPREQG